MSFDYTTDYVRDARDYGKPDYSYEDILIAEVRKLEAENATLRATIKLVQEVLDRGGDPGRVAGNLDTV